MNNDYDKLLKVLIWLGISFVALILVAKLFALIYAFVLLVQGE